MPGRLRYDVVYASDLHVMGGTNAALVSHVTALAARGYRVGLVPLHLPHAMGDKPLYGKVRATVNAGLAEIIDSRVTDVDCDLFVIDNPSLLMVARKDLPSVRVAAPRTIIIVPFPTENGLGQTYDPILVQLNAAQFTPGPYTWAPVSPLIRAQLAETYPYLALSASDAGPIIDETAFPFRERSFQSPMVIGRHSRPQAEKWPADRAGFLNAYPIGPDIALDFLGIAPADLEKIIGPLPAGLRTQGYNAEPVADYLNRIDLFCYFHHPDWIEALGIVVVEAMLSGVPCLLPEYMRENFGDNAFYADPERAGTVCRALLRRPEDLRAMAKRARSFAADRFGDARFQGFLDEIRLSPPRAVSDAPRFDTILLGKVDGIGLGPTHLLEEAILLARTGTVAIAPTSDRVSTFVRQTLAETGITLLAHTSATCSDCIVMAPFSDEAADRLHRIRAARYVLRVRGDEAGKAGRGGIVRMGLLSASVTWQAMDRAAQVALEKSEPNAAIVDHPPLTALSALTTAYLIRRKPRHPAGVTGIFMPADISAPLLAAISAAQLRVSFFGKPPNFRLRHEFSGQHQDLPSWIARLNRLIVAAGQGMGRAELGFLQLMAESCRIPFVPVRLTPDTPWTSILRDGQP